MKEEFSSALNQSRMEEREMINTTELSVITVAHINLVLSFATVSVYITLSLLIM